MMVNPDTAQVLPEVQGRKLLLLIQQIHRNLTAGEFGKQITGACALMLHIFCFERIIFTLAEKALCTSMACC